MDCCLAALAARCLSWSSLRSALVMFFWDLGGGWDEPSAAAAGPFVVLCTGRTGAGTIVANVEDGAAEELGR